MNPDQLLKEASVPLPPRNLRTKILQQPFFTQTHNRSLLDRVWESRMLRWSWAVSVTGLALFLIFWNPVTPGAVPKQILPEQKISFDGMELERLRPQPSKDQKRAELQNILMGANS